MKLFDALFGKMIDRRIAVYQNDLMDSHAAEVENMYRQVRGWRHDYANQLQTMKTLLDSGEYEKLGKYMDSLGSKPLGHRGSDSHLRLSFTTALVLSPPF